MNEKEKELLRLRIVKRLRLRLLNASRWKRFLIAPIYSSEFYIKQALAYIHPFKVRRKTLWGDTMEYYLPEAASIYYYGFWEAGLTNYLINTLQEKDVFFDVGAHVGFYSMLASNLVGEKGTVCGFEPTPRTFRSLERNLGTKPNAKAYNVAVLNQKQTITFTDYGPKYSAFNTFKKRTDSHMSFLGNGELVTVQTISLDEFCIENQLIPTFIKIDVEGAEHLVLQSMEKLLKTHTPTLSIEVSANSDFKDNTKTSIDFLHNHGYIGFLITPEGGLLECTPGEEYLTDNLIFKHSSKLT